jgi:hypothetical protein
VFRVPCFFPSIVIGRPPRGKTNRAVPIRTHRESTFQAPGDVVWQAILTVGADAFRGEAVPHPKDGTIVFERPGEQWERTTFKLTAEAGGTHVRVDRGISRGYAHGLADIFDFYGQEAQKWLYLVYQEIGRVHAAQPWGAPHAAEPPPGVLPAVLAVGARVCVLDPAGAPHRGAVRAVQAGRYDVAFDGGGEGWFDPHDVHAER